MYRPAILVLTLVTLATQLPSQQPAGSSAGNIDYKKQVQPIFDTNCKACHSGGAAPSGLLLDSGAGLMSGSQSGKVIIPGNSKDSILVQRIREGSMPPSGAGFGNGSLPEAAIETISKWVDQGAKTGEAESTGVLAKQVATPERALLDKYCVTCHNQKLKTAGLLLDEMNPSRVQDRPEQWEKVVRKLRAGMMPPPQATLKPDPATREALISGIEKQLDKNSAIQLPPPGLHRMNRTEYANAIRDLLDVQIDPAQYLPSDDSTRGFDNVAAALSLSPALLEGYVAAARKISRMAVGDVVGSGDTAAVEKVFQVPDDTSQDYHVEGLPFGTRGGLVVKYEALADGDYAFKVWPVNLGNMNNNRAFGDIRGEKLEILVDGERVKLFDWDREIGRGAAVISGTKEVKVPLKAGLHTLGVTFLATNYAPGNDLDQHFLRSTIETGGVPGFTFFPHVGKLAVIGPYDAKGATDSPSRSKIFVCKPASADKETTCAKEIVTTLGRRAFRRPISAQDTETLMGFYQQGRNDGGDFDHGIEMALRRILADPEFVFRKEAEPANVKPGQKYRISDLELASRLSFFLWSSIPDDDLIKVAGQNKLHEPAVLEAQVKRMLADPKSDQLVNNFIGQWLNVRGLATAAPVTAYFPDFDDNLRQAMRREMEMFVGSVVHEDRSLTDLLTGNYTYLNERLAKHYGVPNVYGSFFRRVTLPPEFDARRGLLGKGAFLTISSQPSRTSPVGRGKEVMQIFLGVEPPNPPPNVVIKLASTENDAHGGLKPSMRQQMEMHRSNEPCHSCHQIMDPIGFSLENFDATGAWRSFDGGNPIDTAGKLVDGTQLDGVKGLRDALVRYTPQFVRVITEKLMIYALGRGTEYFDMPVVRSIVHDDEKNNYRFSTLVLGIVKSDAFQMNMNEGTEKLAAN
jgi:hypothetical protein